MQHPPVRKSLRCLRLWAVVGVHVFLRSSNAGANAGAANAGANAGTANAADNNASATRKQKKTPPEQRQRAKHPVAIAVHHVTSQQRRIRLSLS